MPTRDDTQVLNDILEALRAYHFSLDLRQNGGVAAQQFVASVQRTLAEPYVQGVELARRERRGSDHGREKAK